MEVIQGSIGDALGIWDHAQGLIDVGSAPIRSS